MLSVILQTTVQLVALRLGERRRLRLGGDAVPDVFDQLDTLSKAEFQYIGE